MATQNSNLAFFDMKDAERENAVVKFLKNGIINGNEDGSFRPDGRATRAEAAKMLYGLLQYFK